jgi:glycerol-3-phosphate O-acyltransferase
MSAESQSNKQNTSDVDYLRWKDSIEAKSTAAFSKIDHLKERADKHDRRTETLEVLMREMKVSFDRLAGALTGTMGMPGMIDQMKSLTDSMKSLEEHTRRSIADMEKRYDAKMDLIEKDLVSIREDTSKRKSFVAGALFVGSIFGTIVGFLAKLFFNR